MGRTNQHPSSNDAAPATLGAGLAQYFETNGLGFGKSDILCLGPTRADHRVYAIFGTLLGFGDGEGRSPIQSITIVMPAATLAKCGGALGLRSGLGRLVTAIGRTPPIGVTIDDWIQVVASSDLRSSSAVELIRAAPARSALIIVDAASYRAEHVQPHKSSSEAGSPVLAEDYWVPQLHALAQQATELARTRGVHALLDAGKSSPHRPALRALLQSIEDAGVLGSQLAEDPNEVLADQVDDWARWLGEGRLGAVLKSIEELPAWLDREKPFLRIQMFHRAGLHGQALEAIEALPVLEHADPFGLAKLARMAADAGAGMLGARLLSRAVSDLDTTEAFEVALATAAYLGHDDLEERIAARFQQLFPGSTALKRRERRMLVSSGDYASAAALLEDGDSPENKDLYRFLAAALSTSGVPDYLAARQRLEVSQPTWAPQARSALVRDALRRGLIVHAFDLAFPLPTSGEPRRGEIDVVLDVIDDLLLHRDAHGEPAVDLERLKGALIGIVTYLSLYPSDGAIRVRLARLLSIEVSGSLGIPLIASATLDLMKRPWSLQNRVERHKLSAEELLSRRPSLERAFAWLSSESPVVLGRAVLPPSLLPDPPDELVPAIADVLEILGSRIADEADLNALTTWLLLGVSMAPHTSNPDQDLAMIRLVAGRLVLAGRVQQARDMAEQALQASGMNPARKRAGWSTMADVYSRLGNNLEALIALACAAAGNPSLAVDEAWHEAYTLVRILRDLGLFDFARQAHAVASDLLRRTGLGEANQHRHEFMSLQIEMAQLLREPERVRDALPSLIPRFAENAREALARNDDPLPAAMMLGQLMRIAEREGVAVPSDARAAFEALLERTGLSMGRLVRTMSSRHPSADDVLLVHKGTETARYSDDVGYDSRNAVLAARRLLSRPEIGTDPDSVALAIELLADRAIATPGWETTAKPPSPLASTVEAAAMAKEISARGVSVVMAGFDVDEQLVRVTAADGHLDRPVRENERVFSGEELQAWSREFPYRYGIDETTPNLFHLSTDRLRLSTLPEGRVLLVADTELQQFPPNLLRVDDVFAGQTRPMATAPSLSWLSAALKKPSPTTGRMAAWISIEETQGHTLAMIAERLSEAFAKHGIELDTGSVIPDGLARSELVVVAAHGAIAPEGRFFHRVSSEGDLTVLGAELAGALRNVGVVVLFVCSAGRADKHPAANTTIGLAKGLLDRGCSTVIASPWPLDARVPYHWLPPFLDAWKSGSMLIDANFQANLAVAKGVGDDPAKCLAMTVFGDPFRTVGQSQPTKGLSAPAT